MATTSNTTRMSRTPPMTPPAMAPATIVKLGQESDNHGKGMPVYGHTLRMLYLFSIILYGECATEELKHCLIYVI